MSKKTSTYLFLRDTLAERIAKGLYPEGVKLPSERELAEDLGTTRLTLRDALSQLELEGQVFRMDRRGWFVSGKRLQFDPTVDNGFMNLVREQGREPHTELLSCEEEEASEHLARAMKLKPGASIYHLQRKRSINDRPVLMEDIYLEAARYPGLQHTNLDNSVTQVLAEVYGAKTRYSDLEITPVAFNNLHARSLLVSPGTPATLLARTTYDQRGGVIKYEREYWLSDVLKIVVRTREEDS